MLYMPPPNGAVVVVVVVVVQPWGQMALDPPVAHHLLYVHADIFAQ